MAITITDQQKKDMDEFYYDIYFHQAARIDRADRPLAEKSAILLADIFGLDLKNCIWVESPQEAQKILAEKKLDHIRQLINSFKCRLERSFEESIRSCLERPTGGYVKDALRDWLWSNTHCFLDHLDYSFYSVTDDVAFVSYYEFCMNELGVEVRNDDRKAIEAFDDLISSCFAVWINPDIIILCERPKKVIINNESIEGFEWYI